MQVLLRMETASERAPTGPSRTSLIASPFADVHSYYSSTMTLADDYDDIILLWSGKLVPDQSGVQKRLEDIET